jgi:hypothetical protein
MDPKSSVRTKVVGLTAFALEGGKVKPADRIMDVEKSPMRSKVADF